jgi:hypothetical protein
MKSETKEKIGQFLLSLVCLAAYLYVFVAVIANAFDTKVSRFLLG